MFIAVKVMINESHEGIMKMPWKTLMCYIGALDKRERRRVTEQKSKEFTASARKRLGLK